MRWVFAICAIAGCDLVGGSDRDGDGGAVDAAVDDFDCGSCDCFRQVEAGEGLSCALETDGSVWCWGTGPVGDGTTETRLVPVRVTGLSDVAQISVGRFHACALRSDGTIWCWGKNRFGQLGEGTTDDEAEPVQVMAIPIASGVVTTGNYSCAHFPDGKVDCWGRSYIGTAQYIQADQISIGDDHLCSRKSDGTIWCIGSNENGELGTGETSGSDIIGVQSQLTDAVDLAVTQFRTTIVRQDQTVWWTGWSAVDGTHPDPVQIDGLIAPVDVQSGQQHDCARDQDGSLWCWGNNEIGQLGNGTTEASAAAVRVVGLVDVTGHDAGRGGGCALATGRPIQCWGFNDSGQLGNGSTTSTTTPVPVHLACP